MMNARAVSSHYRCVVVNVFGIRLGALFHNQRRSFDARPKHELTLRWGCGRGEGVSVHCDDLHEGAVFGIIFIALKSENDKALTKSLISLWVVSARAVAERQANTTAHKRIATA